MSKRVADVLRAAADLIEPKGKWVQGDFVRNKSGQGADEGDSWPRGRLCFCMIGAISRAQKEPVVVQSSVLKYVRALGFEWPSEAAIWNDAPERTQAEVVAKLREAADKAEAEA